jgi:hypothetical protein
MRVAPPRERGVAGLQRVLCAGGWSRALSASAVTTGHHRDRPTASPEAAVRWSAGGSSHERTLVLTGANI